MDKGEKEEEGYKKRVKKMKRQSREKGESKEEHDNSGKSEKQRGRLKAVGGKEKGNELGLSPPARGRAWWFPPNSVGSTRFSLPLYIRDT